MEPALKQRLIGALVISALAVVFLPKLIVGHDKDNSAADVSLQVPGAPDRNFETRELPLTAPGATPAGGVVGMNTSAPPLPSVQPPVGPASTDAGGAPLAIDPNATAVPAPAVAAPNSANGATTVPPTLPTTQNAPATPVAGPVVASTSTPPVSTSPSTALPATAVPPPALPAAPIPATHAGGNYVVSAGIYSNSGNAQSLVNSLKAAQLPAYAETVTANGKSSTRVRIGPFAQRGDAEAARLRAQQVRKDMSASVTALDAAAEAPPATAFNSAAGKPAAGPAAIKPVASTVPSASPIASTPAAPAAAASNSATGKPAELKPVATAPASPAAAGRGFVVQVIAFRTEEEALALRNRLRAGGFTAFSEPVRADSGTLYRVRVGPTADRAAADLLRASLSQKMGLSGVVVAYP